MLAVYALASTLMASAVSAANHTVIVGGTAGLKFVPETIIAEVGDFITYVFQSRNHTVTQSAFAAPCKLLQNATINAVGFDSGFVPVAADATDFPAWTIEITAKAPIWYYCAQGNHCAQGMVGAINAPATGERTFEAFKALAVAGPPASAAYPAYGSSAAGGVAASVASPTTTGINVAGRPSSTVLNASQVSSAADSSANQAGGTGRASGQMHVGKAVAALSLTIGSIALFI